jgi:phosphomannomutase
VNADESSRQDDAYRCPGEQHPISRAVHLGRLAAFYPACRQCPRREETGTISPRRVAQLAETSGRGVLRPLFHDEGAGGVYLNDLTPGVAREIAAAFGAAMSDEKGKVQEGESGMQSAFSPLVPLPPSPPLPFSSSSILLAGDARPLSAELVAAAAEGIRSTGCNVIDIGPSTAACLAFAVHHLGALGGVLVGNPGDDSHTVGMKFWAAESRPLSAGGSLEPVIERFRSGVTTTVRRYGELHRFQADAPYLAEMAKQYHALRPLRVVVDSASKPTLDFLQRLAAAVACEIIPRQIDDTTAHFAVRIDGDGETCRAMDEQGRDIRPERLLLLLAAVGIASKGETAETVVVETETPPAVAERLEQLGVRVVASSPRRADMFDAMREHGAILGGGPSGRFWHSDLGLPLCDALMTVTHLLQTLSRGDVPLSKVLDHNAALE